MGGTEATKRTLGRNPRALATPTAAVVMIVVLVALGAGAFFGVGNPGSSTSSSTVTKVLCTPPTAPQCTGTKTVGQVHDLSVLAAFQSAQTLSPIPFTIELPAGDTATSYSFDFGDGVHATSGTSTMTHSFQSPGIYLITVNATVQGTVHDNYHSILVETISGSYIAASGGANPTVSGSITANASSTTGPTGVLSAASNSISISGVYTGAPTNPDFSLIAPTLSVSGSSSARTVSASVITAASASATVTVNSPGSYLVTFVGSAQGNGPFAGQTAFQNFTWTIILPASGLHGLVAGKGAATSPHPGTFIYYSGATGGAQSLDPAIAYDTASYEPILNVYEGLIAFNGSQTGPSPSSYIPQISTCVPGAGSLSCGALYGGNTLFDATTQAYTFPIDANARFYDSAGGKSWAVYPSDVLYTVMRTAGFSTVPSYQSHNGWILAQALLPGTTAPSHAANPAWDSGTHSPLNNTRQNIFAAVLVNSSQYCTAAVMAGSNGCVTFLASGNGQSWPYFLELIGDQLGGSIVSCGWGSSSSGGDSAIPGWTDAMGGDHPCALPGGATSSDATAYKNAVAAMDLTPGDAWDQYLAVGGGTTPPGVGGTGPGFADNMVGTGPYYLSGYSKGQFYNLGTNPVYAPNSHCTWTGCMPQIGSFAPKVQVIWITTPTQGEQAFASGSADTAGIPSTDTPFLLDLIHQGRALALSFPSISIYFFLYNFNFNLAGARALTTTPINIPTDWFAYLGMRQFFSTSYPYTTIANNVLTKDGIQYGFNYGGAIPQFMANYYPTNVSWPSQDPATACAGAGANGPLCPSWWWTQMTTPGTPYYDPYAAACTTANPCQLPLFGETGSGQPQLDQQEQLWISQLTQFSGGKLKITSTDLNFITLVIDSEFTGPTQDPLPVSTLGWAPDYPDPTDYVGPLYFPDNIYTYPNAVYETIKAYNSTSCSTNGGYYASLTTPVNQSCQGAAYDAMNALFYVAAVTPAGPQRVLLYTMGEHIAAELNLYQYQYQANEVFVVAPWVNLATIDTNVTTGGGTDVIFYFLGGNGIVK